MYLQAKGLNFHANPITAHFCT